MRALLCLAVLCLVLTGCQKPPARDLQIQHHLEETETPRDLILPERSPWREGRQNAVGETAVLLGTLVNTAEKAWALVERNRPVTQVSGLFANALPKGVESGGELEAFSDLQKRSFRSYGTNPFGATVYDVEYTVLHRYGGSYEGKGRYLDQVTIVPTYVKALWGYTVDVTVTSSPPTNVGTAESPVSGLLLELSIRVSTLVKSADGRRVFEFRGDSPDAAEVTTPRAHATAKLAAVFP
jgi:hypothetical protein